MLCTPADDRPKHRDTAKRVKVGRAASSGSRPFVRCFGSDALVCGDQQPVEDGAGRQNVAVLQVADILRQLFCHDAQLDVCFLRSPFQKVKGCVRFDT